MKRMIRSQNGQANIEFVISVLVFLITLSFVLFTIINNLPVFHRESVKDALRSKGFQVSQLLVMDQGYPQDWSNLANAQRLGLTSGEPYILVEDKVLALSCDGDTSYNKTKQLLGLGYQYDIIINITKINFTSGNDEQVSVCKPKTISLIAPKFWVKRFAVIDNEVVRVNVVVY